MTPQSLCNLVKYLDAAQLQRQRAYNYSLKVKDNADYKEKVNIRTDEYYINNKDLLKQKERLKYKSSVECHDKLRAKALEKLKTADIPKLRRGRKPKPKDEDIDDKPSPKPNGRPKTKSTVNVETID